MQFNSSQFTYTKNTKTFSGFASDLGLSVGIWPFDFNIISAKTRRVLEFRLVGSNKDADGDLIERIYRPVDLNFDLRVVIYND